MTNFAQDVTEIRKMTEADIFKAASQEEIMKRREEYDALRKKEKEDKFKELGPKMEKVQALLPIVKALQSEYTDDQADWMGNYSESRGDGTPTQISFNIKIYGISIPDDVQEKINTLGLQSQMDDFFWNYMNDSLEWFLEDLEKDYDFIEKTYQEGRMGGWLVLEISSLSCLDDLDTVFEQFVDQDMPDDEWLTETGVRDAYNILRDSKKELEKRIKAFHTIEKRVETGKKGIEKTLESKEFWDDFFEGR